MKFLKFGYGKVSDHASRDIRLMRMSRDEGAKLVAKYQSIKPKALPKFLEWIGLTEDEFMSCVDSFRDMRAWNRNNSGEWELLD